MAVTYSTRGDFAEALYTLLGITTPSSTNKFSDAGGAASTLMDLGITNGIGNGEYGTNRTITRGEAFTMIARALGMADKNTSIEKAAAMLVEANIIKGYNGDPNQLGLNDPLQSEHLGLLLDPKTGRIAPLMNDINDRTTGETLQESIQQKADDARNTNIAENDPAFATFLAEQGIRKANVQAEIDRRYGTLYGVDIDGDGIPDGGSLNMLYDDYADQIESSNESFDRNFQDRGLFRSTARVDQAAEAQRALENAMSDKEYSYINEYESWLAGEQDYLRELDREVLMRASNAEEKLAKEDIESAYEYTFEI